VGTQATVKTISPDELRALGAEVILGNTYHLHLRPGSRLIQQLGGLHRFMSWDRSLLTDSGGFQVFSLGHLCSLDEDGVTFRSHVDGSLHLFTPEEVTRVQEELGSDIAMVLDECTPYPVCEMDARRSFERTVRWAERARDSHRRADQVQFGIVQGGMYGHLREESARRTVALDFPGYAIGGLSVGEPKDVFYRMLAVSAKCLPADRPRYLMGVGAPEDLFQAVENGIDMFDCVLQTRLGRNGSVFTRGGRINITNAPHRDDPNPIDTMCDCPACRQFSRAYLHHLFHVREMLGYRLATLHNLTWTMRLVADMRDAIAAGTFADFREQFLDEYRTTEPIAREEQQRRRQEARRRA
ncbi:MAG: tRNA guanosine(34) transglycosylase Tgt, partial [Chloroflexota bacterium]